MPREWGRVVRPLLDLSRADVLKYLEEKSIPFRTDSTNADIRFLRNRVRLRLIPCLDEFFPQWRKGLFSLGETQAMAAAFLAAEARRRVPWEEQGPALRTGAGAFFAEPPLVREEALFRAADLLARRGPEGGASGRKTPALPRRAVLRRAAAGLDGAADLGPIRLEKEKNFIRVIPAGREYFERGFSLLIKAPGSYTLKDGDFPGISPGGLVFEALEPAGPPAAKGFFARLPLVLRAHREGDLVFRAGQKRRLSDILKNETLSEYSGFITAQDSEGPAAFIALSGKKNILLLCRESTKGAAAFIVVSAGSFAGSSAGSSIEIFGGIDV
jgi:tRNA(Ile)-lysidine synthase